MKASGCVGIEDIGGGLQLGLRKPRVQPESQVTARVAASLAARVSP